jgi:hypothetical protein
MTDLIRIPTDRWLPFGNSQDADSSNAILVTQSDSETMAIDIRYRFDRDEVEVFCVLISKEEFSRFITKLLDAGFAHYLRTNAEEYLEMDWRLCLTGFDLSLKARGQFGLVGRTQLMFPYFEHVELSELLSLASHAPTTCAHGQRSGISI